MDYDQPDPYDSDSAEYARRRFRDPGGRSALHPGKRYLPCPTCKEPRRLTKADRASGYQCDQCADRAEGGGF